jgi:RNA recognition motif-containing protein
MLPGDGMLFIGNIPAGFTDECLRELLESFGEIKELRRECGLDATPLDWALVTFTEASSVPVCYTHLHGLKIRGCTLVVQPQHGQTDGSSLSDGVQESIARAIERYEVAMEMDDCLRRFIDSHGTMHSLSDAYTTALDKWRAEEREIHRRYEAMERERMALEQEYERRAEGEYNYLHSYDDDRTNDPFYTDRRTWIRIRKEADARNEEEIRRAQENA